MIEREPWNEYCYRMTHCCYGGEYDYRQYLEYLENKKRKSYIIEEIVDDFLNNL